MAAPNYNTDLVTIDDAETTTGWNQINHAGGGGGALDVGPDFSLQGTNCVDRQVTNNNRGAAYDNGTTLTTSSGDHFYIWLFCATVGLVDTLENEGTGVMVGSSTSDLVRYHVEGSDTYGAAGRAGRCYPVQYSADKLSASITPPYRTITGTPTLAAQVVGGSINTTATVKARNLGVDAVRHGTGLFITGGDSSNVATFSGSAAENDVVANRWGVFSRNGGSFELQGTIGIGIDTSDNADAAYFDDNGSSIQIIDTVHTARDFSKILIDGSSTYCRIQNMTVLSLGTHNPGFLYIRNSSTTASFVGCTFTDFGNTFLNSNVTASNCRWVNSEVIYRSGSYLDTCIIRHSLSAGSASLVTDTLDSIVGCTFTTSSNVVNGGHAIEFTTAGVSASFQGNLFTNFDADDTSGSALFNNSGGNVVINISDGGDTPTVRNSAGSTTQINNPTTLTINDIVSGSEVRLYLDDGPPRTELDGEESVLNQFVYTYNYGGSDQDAILVVGNTGYIWLEVEITLGNTDQVQGVQQILDRNYSNP